jgi:hypothetical protein
VEVALRVHEPHADQRDAEVARLLAVVAGQHAEAARVDGQRLVQGELRREVGDDLAAEVRALPFPPRGAGFARRVEGGDRVVVHRHEDGVVRGALQHVRPEQPEHPGRVVRRGAPHPEIEAAEQLTGAGLPAPPDIGGEFADAVDAGWERNGEAFHGWDWGLGTRD